MWNDVIPKYVPRCEKNKQCTEICIFIYNFQTSGYEYKRGIFSLTAWFTKAGAKLQVLFNILYSFTSDLSLEKVYIIVPLTWYLSKLALWVFGIYERQKSQQHLFSAPL